MTIVRVEYPVVPAHQTTRVAVVTYANGQKGTIIL
jgi:hypothetical protein